MLVKVKVSVKVDGSWKNPGAIVELDDAEGKRLLRLGAAERPSRADIGSGTDTFSSEEMDTMIEGLTSIDGISEKLVGDVIEAGYTTVGSIAGAAAEDLVKIKGIGENTAVKIIESAVEIFNND